MYLLYIYILLLINTMYIYTVLFFNIYIILYILLYYYMLFIYICILSCGFPSVKYPKRDPQKTRSPTLNPGRGSKRQNTYVNFQQIIINMFIMF